MITGYLTQCTASYISDHGDVRLQTESTWLYGMSTIRAQLPTLFLETSYCVQNEKDDYCVGQLGRCDWTTYSYISDENVIDFLVSIHFLSTVFCVATSQEQFLAYKVSPHVASLWFYNCALTAPTFMLVTVAKGATYKTKKGVHQRRGHYYVVHCSKQLVLDDDGCTVVIGRRM